MFIFWIIVSYSIDDAHPEWELKGLDHFSKDVCSMMIQNNVFLIVVNILNPAHPMKFSKFWGNYLIRGCTRIPLGVTMLSVALLWSISTLIWGLISVNVYILCYFVYTVIELQVILSHF
eukprot:UN27033